MKAIAISTDRTFITNEGENTLKERFRVLLKDTRLFDVLVGYFYTSGFYALYRSLENTEKSGFSSALIPINKALI